MAETITVTIGEVVEKQVRLPITCPRCGADFREAGKLREWDLHDVAFEAKVVKEKGGKLSLDIDDEEKRGEYFIPLEFRCKECDQVVPTKPVLQSKGARR